MDFALEILDNIPDNTTIKYISDFIPFDTLDFFRVESLLFALMSLDSHFRYNGVWRKISHQEYIDFRKARYQETFHILMTCPHKLDF